MCSSPLSVQETTHNLATIYRMSGADELVRRLYRRYMVVR